MWKRVMVFPPAWRGIHGCFCFYVWIKKEEGRTSGKDSLRPKEELCWSWAILFIFQETVLCVPSFLERSCVPEGGEIAGKMQTGSTSFNDFLYAERPKVPALFSLLVRLHFLSAIYLS